MAALELSANEFQMNRAAETIRTETITAEANVIGMNGEVAGKVRKAMIDAGTRPPERHRPEQPIAEVGKPVKLRGRQPARQSTQPYPFAPIWHRHSTGSEWSCCTSAPADIASMRRARPISSADRPWQSWVVRVTSTTL